MTEHLTSAGELMGIPVLDHIAHMRRAFARIIYRNEKYYSFMENGGLKTNTGETEPPAPQAPAKGNRGSKTPGKTKPQN